MKIILSILFVSIFLDFILYPILTYMKDIGIVLLRDAFQITWIVSRTINLLTLMSVLILMTFKELS